VDVVVAAGEDGAAIAVGDHVAGDEEGLIGQLEVQLAGVAEIHGHGRADGVGRHRGGRARFGAGIELKLIERPWASCMAAQRSG
jgi:hypothetical protein